MIKKSSEGEIQTFGCQNCGHPYKAYPPDSTFKFPRISPCQQSSNDPNHNYKQGYDCENCGNRNFLYWCQGHFDVFVVGTTEKRRPDRLIGRRSTLAEDF